MTRLAIIATHPIQYYSPWFRHMADSGLDLKVFYLWDFGVAERRDREFDRTLRWDVDLLSGYDSQLLENRSPRPGTAHFFGFDNPECLEAVLEFSPDAVLFMAYRYWGLLLLIRALHSRGIPLLFRGDSHRLVDRHSWRSKTARRFIAAIFRQFAGCLYVGRANREYFTYHGVTDDRLFFSPHAVDNDRFLGARDGASERAARWRRELQIPDDAVLLLFAGKLTRKKRPTDLLAAFRGLDRRQCYLLFVGSGELEQELKRESADHVRFLPFQNQTDMPAVYAMADLFVLPSFGRSETWGLAVNEAMCLGVPVVVSDHVGCHLDLVQGRGTGWVFPAGDRLRLAETLKQAIDDGSLRQKSGTRASRLIRQYGYPQATQGLVEACAAAVPT
ncbi:MAG: glycosyltransferase family 4 protein [Xanthomonadales bacterium]|nr:glycosyltransferase family 4 protein [Xanthomonadales bacterium]